MKKNMKIVAALVSIGLISPMAYATNGDVMMAIGSQNTALGGTGVANYAGAESTWANPAMIGLSKGSEVTGGILLFQPKVTNTGFNPAAAGAKSKSDQFLIPDVSYSSRMSDSLSYGVAFAGIAGMGVDYSSEPTNVAGKSALSLAKLLATIAYNTNDYGVGFSPVMQYGSLALSYKSGTNPAVNGAGDANTSVGYGFNLGGYYNVMPSLVVAAVYESEIAAKYGTQISKAGNGFGLCLPTGPTCPGAPFGDDLNQPAQMKLGVAYTMSNITLTADYKQIKWGEAAGYKDFGWENQNILAVGAKYAGNGYWVGLGYNSTKDPIAAQPTAGNGSMYRNSAINFFNNLFFPAVVENSFTFGGGYDISESFDIEAAAVITPEVTKKVSISDIPATYDGGGNPLTFHTTNTTTHSQQSLSLSLRYKF